LDASRRPSSGGKPQLLKLRPNKKYFFGQQELVGGIPTPLKMSNGIIVLNIWKNRIDVPNHQLEKEGIFKFTR
jgi:hypothetical protein